MSIEQVDKSIALVADDEDLYLPVTRPIDELIDEAENMLKVVFPDDYRYFLKTCGKLSFGSFEVYGILDQGLAAAFQANVVWITSQVRKRGMPADMFLIGNNEIGSPSMKSGHDSVIAYWDGAPAAAQTNEVLATSFGDYLFNSLSQELKWRSED